MKPTKPIQAKPTQKSIPHSTKRPTAESTKEQIKSATKKPTKKQLAEACKDYVCETLCKHTNKKEAALIKQCNQCQLEHMLDEVRRR